MEKQIYRTANADRPLKPNDNQTNLVGKLRDDEPIPNDAPWQADEEDAEQDLPPRIENEKNGCDDLRKVARESAPFDRAQM